VSVRYLGSKTRLLDRILPIVGRPTRRSGMFVDAFCGTGAVAEAAAKNGWPIRLNDNLSSAVIMSHARLLSFRDVPFKAFGGYRKTLRELNEAKSKAGFIWQQYSPASKKLTGIERRYFTEQNAIRIDGIRSKITSWKKKSLLTLAEERLLVADLLLASNRVANIAGTYGCFLSYWSPQAIQILVLQERELFSRQVDVTTSVSDVSSVEVNEEDVVYFDPPYTKRQYAAYYHILETIALGDKPSVGGITGLRPWKDKASAFCYRRRALDALVELIRKQLSKKILLSYSDEGHVALKPLTSALSLLGKLSVMPLKEIGRYRPNIAASNAGGSVTEYLLELVQPRRAFA